MGTTSTTRTRRHTAVTLACAVPLALGLAACSDSGADDGVTELNFFQFKGEALEDFNQIIEDFEADNPDIRVIQNQVADSETSIRTLLVKDRAPDVITLNGNATYGQLATSGVFYDFSDEPVLETINPAVQEILADLGNVEGQVNGIGYVNNADGIIYNREIFAQQGLEIPETWDELIAVCDALRAAGITPFAASAADSWTVMPSWNGIGAYAAEDGFFEQMREVGEDVGPEAPVSFTQDFQEPMERQLQLFEYAQDGHRGTTYDDANAMFANGGAAMMMQGVWALNPVKLVNPDVDAGIFPYPVPENPDDRKLVSGVDVVVTLPADGPHHEEAMRFVEFMLSEPIIERFAESQTMFPSVESAAVTENLDTVTPYFEDGRITGFIDHQVPPSIPLTGTVQQMIFDRDPGPGLATLDNEWRKVAARTIPVTED